MYLLQCFGVFVHLSSHFLADSIVSETTGATSPPPTPETLPTRRKQCFSYIAIVMN
jgi:hypothetical protein